MLVGGLTSEIPHPLKEPEFYNRIHRLSASKSQMSLMTSVLEMQTRYATTPVDIYLSVLPVYQCNEAPGDAWNRFIATTAKMDPLGLDYTFELIKWFPFPSFGHWFPSWEQLIRFPDLGLLPEDQHACKYVSATVHAPLRIIRCLLFRHCKVRTTTMPLHELKYPFRVPPLFRGDPESSEMSISDSDSESAISTNEDDSGGESGPPVPVPDGDISLSVSDERGAPESSEMSISDSESESDENGPPVPVPDGDISLWVSDEEIKEGEGSDNLSLRIPLLVSPVPAPDRSIQCLHSFVHITHLGRDYHSRGIPGHHVSAPLFIYEDLTIMLLPCEAQNENVLVVCREPAETGPNAPEVLHLQRLTTLEWNIGKRGQYFFGEGVQLEGFLKAPDVVLGMEERVDDNVEIYLL
ncbi:hypothetical protein BGX38DRAFT_1243906 [Terfezia claveryi]|nr:hypothetical protein BGX38DRAFT_1243906 [Terfezia claveryi]